MDTYMLDNAELILGDCVEIMSTQISKDSIDMIFADPPYKLSSGGITCKSGKIAIVDKGDWDKPIGFVDDYIFTKAWIAECAKIMKPNGTIWISGTYHNIHSVAFALLELGFYIINELIWYKPNAAPNMGQRCFTASHETLIWAKKSKEAKHCFHYALMKEANQGKQMRSLWSIPTTPKREKEFGYHPTQKPLALLERCILSSTNSNDVVLDPFCGSGTTGVAACKLGRKFIGIETNEKYLQISQKRLQAYRENE